MREPAKDMQRQLGLTSATAIVVGEVIAVGIFLTPAQMIKSLGSPALVLVVWFSMAAMALCGALCYGALAARFPEAGGSYVYLREAYGPLVAFLYGWKSFLVMDPGITAALAVGLAANLAPTFHLSNAGMKLAAALAILAVAATNIAGLRYGERLMRGLTALKLALLGVIIVWPFAGGLGSWENFSPIATQRAGSDPIGLALASGMVAAFFSFGGWWDLSKLGGEVREPARTVPRALVLGVVIVTIVYLTTSAAFMYLVPVERVDSGETFAIQAGEALFGQMGARIFSAIVAVSVLGSLTAIVMAAPRVYYAMARDGAFFETIAAVHPRWGTPARAIILQAALACLLVALGTFNEIIAYFVFATVAFLGLTVTAVFVIRRRSPEVAPVHLPGYPVTPLVFIGLVAVLLMLLGTKNPTQAFLGLAVVLAGVPVYGVLFRRRAKHKRIKAGMEPSPERTLS